MNADFRPIDLSAEFHTEELCHILELSNSSDDPACSIARARVEPGITTRLHRLQGAAERYVILEGCGRAEIGSRPPQSVGPGDVLLIPPGCPQRIANIGNRDLVFLAICTPRFLPSQYEDIDPMPHPAPPKPSGESTRQTRPNPGNCPPSREQEGATE